MKRLTIKQNNIVFYNQYIDKNTIRQLISRLVIYLGNECTAHILDQIKNLGFKHATYFGISLGIDDLLTTPSKIWILKDSEYQIHTSEQEYVIGSINAVERLRHVVETWHTTSEYLKRLMHPHFRIIDPLNPIHIMSFSGARGSTSQVHQLVGMRGLMANPQGNIIDLPIQNNFREGLSLTEYIISCYGARKGVVDTAVRTADAGYLTRRLVEVCQQVIIQKYDCLTDKGIYLNNIKDQQNSILLLSFQDRLVGRVLAKDVILEKRCIAKNKQDVAPSLATILASLKNKRILIRSPLTCRSIPSMCQLCYGWDLSYANLVEIGTAVGIIAGQSIGEPGTQLTLRTFHTGGVFTGDVADHVRASCNGIIMFESENLQATRNRHGRLAFLCKESLKIIIVDEHKETNILTIPKHSLLIVTNYQRVKSKQIIAEVRATITPVKQTVQKDIYSNRQGEIFFKYTSLMFFCIIYAKFMKLSYVNMLFNSFAHLGLYKNHMNFSVDKAHYMWVLSNKINIVPNLFGIFNKHKDYIQQNIPIGKYIYVKKSILSFSHTLYKKKNFLLNKNLKVDLFLSKDNGYIKKVSQDKKHIIIASSLNRINIKKLFNKKDEKTFSNNKNMNFSKKTEPSFVNIHTHIYNKQKKKKKEIIKFFNVDFNKLYKSYVGLLGFFFIPFKMVNFSSSYYACFKNNNDFNKKYFFKIHSIVYVDDSATVNYLINDTNNNILWNFFYIYLLFLTKKENGFLLGQFVFKNAFKIPYCRFPISGQVLSFSDNIITISSGKPYLLTKDTKVYNYHKSVVQEGNRLLTFMYERLKASDIIQGLPKAEQLLEARTGNKSVSILDSRFEFLIQDLKKKISTKILSLKEMDFLMSRFSINQASEALQDSQIEILNEIQNVYLSQGVFIADKHIEIVIRQMTSKVIVIENTDLNYMSSKNMIKNIFLYQNQHTYLPGELLDIIKANKFNNVVLYPVSYKPILLGITKASLNTNSFLAEASFERTITVLSKSAVKSKNDWLKGLKENVLFSNLIPAGTGSHKVNLEVCISNKQKNKTNKAQLFSVYSFNRNFLVFNSLVNKQIFLNSLQKMIQNNNSNSNIIKQTKNI